MMKKGYQDILRLFYYSKADFHLRKIAKETGLNENSTYRFLNKLEDNKILYSRKKGNMKLFSLRNNLNVFSVLSLFDIERFEKLPPIRKVAINYYLASLSQQPVFVILFGSTAKNTFKQQSDIDILLVVNKRFKSENAEEEARSQSGLEVNTFQITYKGFIEELKLKNEMVVQSAINTGFPLINHVKYYGVLNHE